MRTEAVKLAYPLRKNDEDSYRASLFDALTQLCAAVKMAAKADEMTVLMRPLSLKDSAVVFELGSGLDTTMDGRLEEQVETDPQPTFYSFLERAQPEALAQFVNGVVYTLKDKSPSVRTADNPLRLVVPKKSIYDAWGGISQWDPSFPAAFEAFAMDVFSKEQWSLSCSLSVESQLVPYPFQRISALAFHPRIGKDVRLGVYTATGSGKTMMMTRGLDNFVYDTRRRIVIMDSETQIDNFFSKGYAFSLHAEWYRQDQGVQASDTLKEFREWLETHGWLRAYTYTRVTGAPARRGDDGFLNSVMNNFGVYDSLLADSIVILDEAHNIFKESSGVSDDNLSFLREQLLNANGSAMMLCTATPTPELDSFFMSPRLRTPLHTRKSYAITFNNVTSAPMYPPVVVHRELMGPGHDPSVLIAHRVDPLTQIGVMFFPLVGVEIQEYMKARQSKISAGYECRGRPDDWKTSCRLLQNHCNFNRTEEPTTKLKALGLYLNSVRARKVVVMVLEAQYQHLDEVAKIVPDDGTRHVFYKPTPTMSEVSIRNRIRAFSDAPANERNIAFFDGHEYREGIDLVNVSELLILNPPPDWKWFSQLVGRVLRGCKNDPTVGLCVTICAAIHPLVATADELVLSNLLVAQRPPQEKLKRERTLDSLCANLIAHTMNIAPEQIDPYAPTVQESMLHTRMIGPIQANGTYDWVPLPPEIATMTSSVYASAWVGDGSGLRPNYTFLSQAYVTMNYSAKDQLELLFAKNFTDRSGRGRGGRGRGRGRS